MYDHFGKRFLDILIVLIALILLWPLLALVSLLIKIFDPGPIIFKQLRIGKDEVPFTFYKFRSMPVNTGDRASDELGLINMTWIGRLIRRTSLDELPQLFNILKGDMSIVGPRPPIPQQKELIKLRIDSGAIKCRPGLTGLAQVSSFDGMSVCCKAEFDSIYSKNIVFIGDIRIILRTFIYLFKPPPIY